MKALGRDLRERTLRAVERGEPMPRGAARFEVGYSSVKKLNCRRRDVPGGPLTIRRGLKRAALGRRGGVIRSLPACVLLRTSVRRSPAKGRPKASGDPMSAERRDARCAESASRSARRDPSTSFREAPDEPLPIAHRRNPDRRNLLRDRLGAAKEQGDDEAASRYLRAVNRLGEQLRDSDTVLAFQQTGKASAGVTLEE